MGAIMAGAGIIKSGLQLAGALKNKGAVDQELKTSRAKFQKSRDRYENFQFTNPWQQAENVAEDLTVNTQAAEFQAMNADQALAASLETMRETGGGAGSAQAIANAALASQQGISASIAQQEQQNQIARARGAMEVQNLRLQGEEDIQTQRLEQTQGVLNMNQARMQAANQAKNLNQQRIAGSATGLASGLGGALGSSNLLNSGIAGGQSKFDFNATSILTGNGIPEKGSYDKFKDISEQISPKTGFNVFQGF